MCVALAYPVQYHCMEKMCFLQQRYVSVSLSPRQSTNFKQRPICFILGSAFDHTSGRDGAYAAFYSLVSKFVEVRDGREEKERRRKGWKEGCPIEEIKFHGPLVAAHLFDFTHKKKQTLLLINSTDFISFHYKLDTVESNISLCDTFTTQSVYF